MPDNHHEECIGVLVHVPTFTAQSLSEVDTWELGF